MVSFCAGIDLAASESRYSGISVISIKNGHRLELTFIGKALKDDDLLEVVVSYGVKAVAIDAPLSLPRVGHYRKLDLELRKRGFKVLPPTWRSMKSLTQRAIRLATRISNLGVAIFETHPLSCIKSSGCTSFEELMNKLDLRIPGRLSKDEKDSIVAALACAFHKLGKSLVIVTDEGSIVLLPKIC